MTATINWHGQVFEVAFDRGTSLAIALDPQGAQPSFFADRKASTTPLAIGDYIGSVKAGGSCNAEVLSYIPHCHGTHTECIGHLTEQRISVSDKVDASPCVAVLITLSGTTTDATDESYTAGSIADEPLMTLQELQQKLAGLMHLQPKAIIIRTLPNPPEKKFRDYAEQPLYPVFSGQAISWLAQQNLRHLLLDTPSLDRAHDGGALGNHRVWWDVGLHPEAETRSVTEMIYVADELADGAYWLQLGLQALQADAVSSNPLIYPLKGAGHA